MQKNKNITLVIVIAFIILAACAYVKFLNYDKVQKEKIAELEEQIALLNERITIKDDSIWKKDTYNYLAIGNSITIHDYADYWWNNECGMAASSPENDYFHLVTDGLKEKEGMVTSKAYSFIIWETLATDRAETLAFLDEYLSNDLDLITIQLGENATDLTTFESDYGYLIAYIKEKAPNAAIYVIGDFWIREDRDEQKERAAKNNDVTYISLDEIKENKDYMAGMGTTVYDNDGSEHVINHNAVANHPGDKGMEYIANKILDEIL